MIRSRLHANIKYVVTTLYSAIKMGSLTKLIMVRAATLSKIAAGPSWSTNGNHR